MKNILALLAFALLVFAGVGWYLGWYKIQSTPTADGHRQISIDLNTPKITDDLNTGKEKLRDLLTSKEKETSEIRQTVIPGHPDNTSNVPVSYRVTNDGSTIVFPDDPTLPSLPVPPKK